MRRPHRLATKLAAGEWTRPEDLTAFVRDEPAGSLGVVVLRGREPLADARVRVWAEAAWVGNAAETAATTPWAEARTDRDGRAQFAGAAAGQYVVRADAGGAHLFGGIDNKLEPNRTLVLVFGTCTVTGRVCDAAGVAVVGGSVRLRGAGSDLACVDHRVDRPRRRARVRGRRRGAHVRSCSTPKAGPCRADASLPCATPRRRTSGAC